MPKRLMQCAVSVVFSVGLSVLPFCVSAGEIGNEERGARIFRKCVSCHRVGPDAENGVGPHLNGVFGRKAASVGELERYSRSLRRAGADGLIWEIDTLDAFLENPISLVSGTRMNFRGLQNEQDRRDVLAFLRLFSDNPQNVPEASPTAIPSEIELSAEVLSLKGDIDYGEYLSSECLTCHKADGGDDGIPAIVGWPKEDFVIAMHAYKKKLRAHPVMQMMAGRLSDEEIAALAAYFAEL